MEVTMGLAVALGALPLLGCLLWWWNDILYGFPVKIRCSGGGRKLPLGHMGIPFFGEMLSFLWYFKVLRRPDDFINSKRSKYGDGVGMYRTHLFGSPGIIACSPAINKFIFKSDTNFILKWPAAEIVGLNSLVTFQGSMHTKVKSLVTRAINQPDALRRIALMVQPRVIAALRSWADKGRIVAIDEAKKVTFQNIGKYFASLESGPLLDTLDVLFYGLVQGFRCHPIYIPGTAYYHAIQCRRRLVAIFREQLEKKRKSQDETKKVEDLMDGLMNFKDGEGKNLNDIEVLDNIVSLVIAGYESTSLAIMWALYYLAKYPNVLQKLREEHLPISKKNNGEFITSDDISKMSYTNKVVEEIIRLANVVPVVFREAKKDVEYKGYIIPKGWKVFLWIRYIHTHPDNFTDPLCFNPERWTDPPKPGSYQVFGGGSRTCAGNMLARLQIAIFLHHLVVGYTWELINPKSEMIYLQHPKPADGVEISFNKISEAQIK